MEKLIGMIILAGMIIVNILLSHKIADMKKLAIERKCASYNIENGQFEWEVVK